MNKIYEKKEVYERTIYTIVFQPDTDLGTFVRTCDDINVNLMEYREELSWKRGWVRRDGCDEETMVAQIIIPTKIEEELTEMIIKAYKSHINKIYTQRSKKLKTTVVNE